MYNGHNEVTNIEECGYCCYLITYIIAAFNSCQHRSAHVVYAYLTIGARCIQEQQMREVASVKRSTGDMSFKINK